ncbi:MAG TPA: carboxypeptidase regulatory-like domain-containing protein [Terriglobia bacterium]|nr:carboxypeptidase regulatory-like domain-containing protein [Terriglobia bacterium]
MSFARVSSAILLILAVVSLVNAQTTTGSIFGDVTDASGAVLTGVTVRIASPSTGINYEGQTDRLGSYQFAGLAPADYVVTLEFPGFRTMMRSGIALPIQGRIKLDFRMEVGTLSESITVTEGAPLVQTSENVLQTVIGNRLVRDLPLKTRDFMDLSLLAPGVVLDQSSVRNGATDSISFFGLEEAYKTIWLEGVDFNDEATTGGTNISPATRTRLGLEAIQEFQVMATGYSAEFGRSGSGAVNVILKSGGNDIHGNAFYFLRDDSFDKPVFQIINGIATPVANVPPFRRQQYGGTWGGPFVRDKAFYFVSVERQTSRESSQVVVPPQVRTFVDGLRMGYDTRSVVPRTRNQVNSVGKLNFNLGASHRLDLTYLYDDDNDVNKNVSGSKAADNGFDDINSSYFATASLTSHIGGRVVNELRLNRSIQRLMRSIPASAHFLPTLAFPTVSIGVDGAAAPQGRTQKNWVVANTMTYQWGHHLLKWGGEINAVRAPVLSNENFNGAYRFPRDEAPFVPDRYTAGLNLQFTRNESPDPTYTTLFRDMNMYALFANDTWRVRPNLTLNLGLRYDLRNLKGDLGGPDAFQQPGFSRERPEDVWINVALGPAGALGVRPWRPMPNDTLDLSPRFGFSWDLMGNGKAAVRGSYGIFQDRITSVSLRGAVNSYNGLNIQSVELANPTFFPLVPNAANLPAAAVTSSTVPSPKGNTPYTQQWSGGFEYAITPGLALSADFIHLLGLNFQMIRNVNAPLPLTQTGGARVCPFGNALRAKGLPECFQMQTQHDMSDRIHLDALALRLERRFANRLGFLLGYTLGSVKTWSTGGFGTVPTDANEKFRNLDYGPSDNDVRHRFTGNVVYELPYRINVGAIVTANSAAPYNHTTGRDDNLDFVNNDRLAGVRFNDLRGDSFFATDLRLTKKFSLGETKNVEFMWEMFNLFNTVNLADYNGNERATTFRQARSALSPFQAQLGVRFTF